MNNLSRDQQIQIIACLTEGQSIRSTERLTGVHRDTIMRLGARVGRGCDELHDRMMVGIRTGRLELDEAWSFVGKKQKNVLRHEVPVKGDQYIYVGMSATAKAIISYRVGKRDSANTTEFLYDLRERVIGQPEISTDGFLPYRNAIRDAFGTRATHGVIVKTYSVTDLVKEAAVRYSPAAVVAVDRVAVSGMPGHMKRFLIVEDEPLVALLVTDMLEEVGHVVAHEAATLEKAFEIVSTGDFDAAILDTNLQGKEVFAVAEMLAAEGKPFFFSTGYSSSQMPEPWNHHCVMEKPFDLHQLMGCINGLFENLPQVSAPSLEQQRDL